MTSSARNGMRPPANVAAASRAMTVGSVLRFARGCAFTLTREAQ